ncbi:hypothetical protein HLB23_23870 [Nocardia uniformis]|uniref:Uncharacterized protein n=1 Tax=Nocardia uniformis TaxID=53432 RepID=A0A849C504_9NOCA|nr:hypothetical protein [Nocardia uniformis]NNH72858.1 hypothetical protein [Nocardia uniformis]
MSEVPIPTVSQVLSWDVGGLAAQGSFLTQQATKFKTEVDTVTTNVGSSADFVIGKFGTALRERGTDIGNDGGMIVGAIAAAGTAITNGTEGLSFAQQAVTTLVRTITTSGYLWGEHGGVTLSLAQLADALSDQNNGVIRMAVLQREANDYAASLRLALAAAGEAAHVVATGITEGFGQLPETAEAKVGGTEGQELGEQVGKDGDIPPEVLTEVGQMDSVVSFTNSTESHCGRCHSGQCHTLTHRNRPPLDPAA